MHDDDFWRPPSSTPESSLGGVRPRPLPYLGPPSSNPPPAGWQPPHRIEPAPPRQLPAQNHAQIDADEDLARRVTRGLAIAAGVVMLVLLCGLCGHLFLS